MSVSTLTTIDPADVAVVLTLAPQVRGLMAAIDGAQPALKRLIEADYPGAYDVADELENVLGEGASSGELRNVVRSLEAFQVGAGIQAALDYHELCELGGLTVGKAAAEILDGDVTDEKFARIEALRRYTASRA